MAYIRKPRSYFDEGEFEHHEKVLPDSLTVHEQEKQTFIGLYDHEGNPIYKVNDFKMGFV